jgi:Asp/Glu/hydantoin racemase
MEGWYMTIKLFLLHTVTSLVEVFKGLCDEVMPDVEVVNIIDESLLKDAMAIGRLTPSIYRRVGQIVLMAQDATADLVLLTCSSISPCVDVVSKLVDIPVLKVDEPMVDKAVNLGNKIGVIATVITTLKPTTDLVRSRALIKEKTVSVHSVLCEGALETLLAGNAVEHDKIVTKELMKLMKEVDVVVLAQASMARVAKTIDAKNVPILSSPRLSVERAKQVIDALKKA